MNIDFVNPYNFVPFGNKIDSKRKSREKVYRGSEQLKSGWLDVLLIAKTPVIVPDGAHPSYIDVKSKTIIKDPDKNQKDKAHKEYKLFNIKDEEGKEKYIIPGSELRGCIRSYYEAVTDSCMPVLLDDKPISQRLPLYGGFSRRGLFTYDTSNKQWKLYCSIAETEEVSINSVKIDDKVSYSFVKKSDGRTINELPGDYVQDRGYVQYNVPVNTKAPYHVAYLKMNEELFCWEPDDDEPYRELRSALNRDGAEGNQKNPNKRYTETLLNLLEKAKSGKKVDGRPICVPVYYVKTYRNNKPLFYMSGSAIGRIGQHRKWKDIMGTYSPCGNTNALCPACVLFGTTNGDGLKSHVRFSDASPIDNVSTEKHTLDILGLPRTSAFEFYLRKPTENATYWNFDFYGEMYKNELTGKDQIQYKDLENATPRGRKMYWHSYIANDSKEITKLNSTMQAYSEGSRFSFRIYFDEITDEQLNDLMWIISLGDNDVNSRMCHKLGHAKSLGYGSSKMVITGGKERKLSNNNGNISYTMSSIDNVDNIKPSFDMDSDTFSAFTTMVNMDTTMSTDKKLNVMYPRYLKESKSGKKDDSIYNWFANNRNNAKKLKVLPEPADRIITLKGSIIDEEKSLVLSEHIDLNNNNYVLGTVTSMNKTGKFVYGRTNDNKKFSAFANNKNYMSGDKIKVILGKYDENYGNYKATIVEDN